MNVSLHSLDARRRTLTLAAWTFLVASPFLLLAAVSVAIGHNALASYPVWTDELDYWRSVFSWLHVDSGVGYSGIGENAAQLGTLSVHGVTPILLYGWYGALFGWGFSSIVVCNALWIAAGALVFCLLNRPKAGTALGLGLSLMVYMPVVLYCATSMTELANYGLLLFYIAFTARLWRVRRTALQALGRPAAVNKGLPALILAFITVALCCTYRISYLGLFLPLAVVAGDGRWGSRMGLTLLAGMLASIFIYYLTSLLSSPFPSGFLHNFFRVGSPGLAVRMFLSHGKANLLDYFVRSTSNPMESLQRWLYCGVAVLYLLASFIRINKTEGRLLVRLGLDGFSLLAFATLLIPFVIIVSAYETQRLERLPHAGAVFVAGDCRHAGTRPSCDTAGLSGGVPGDTGGADYGRPCGRVYRYHALYHSAVFAADAGALRRHSLRGGREKPLHEFRTHRFV